MIPKNGCFLYGKIAIDQEIFRVIIGHTVDFLDGKVESLIPSTTEKKHLKDMISFKCFFSFIKLFMFKHIYTTGFVMIGASTFGAFNHFHQLRSIDALGDGVVFHCFDATAS